MYMENLLEILSQKTGFSPIKQEKNYSTKCPAHEDNNPSLSVSQGNDGKLLMKCFTGCSIDDICNSLSIEKRQLFPSTNNILPRKLTEYHYKDEQGNILYWKVRLEPGCNGKSKSFYCERKLASGQTVKNLEGCRKVLYRLPELIQGISKGMRIYLVEGEKDADRLHQDGCIATTTTGALFWKDEYSKILSEADVVILYDADNAGHKRRDLLCDKLFSKVKRLRVVDLPGMEYSESHGKDVSDWLQEGNTISQLLEIVESTPDYIPNTAQDQNGGLKLVSLEEFLTLKLPKREILLSPFLPTQGLGLLYAKRGVGKTHVAMGIAYAVATGGSFLKWCAPVPRKVVYIDGEMPAVSMQERFNKIVLSEGGKLPANNYLKLLTPDLQEGSIPDLSTQSGRDTVEAYIQECDLLILDNISTLFRTGEENEAASWVPAQEWALKLRKDGKTVLFIHHAGKGGQQRGTSKREDILDVVICLKHKDDYDPEEGASFQVHFEKAREFAGIAASPFQVQLKELDTGIWKWNVTELDTDPMVLEIAKLAKDGLTLAQIQEKTGLTKSKVETRLKKAKKQGLIEN